MKSPRPPFHRQRGIAACGSAVLALLALVASSVRAEPPRDKLRLCVVEGIEFVSDHELPRPRATELAGHFRDVERRLVDELGVPAVKQPVRIYLFATQAAFSSYVREQIPSVGRLDTAGRHGIFLLRHGKPYVFVVAGDDVDRSLRHEAVHVVLNTSHPGLPIWIDEGLAQCYEEGNDDHWCDRAAKTLDADLLRRGVPRAASLAKLKTMPQMGPREYAGAWASMRHLLNDADSGRPELARYLTALRENRTPPELAATMPRVPKPVRTTTTRR